MDFFAHQDRARTWSRRLIALFVVAIAFIVITVDLAAFAGWWLLTGGMRPPRFFLETNTFVILLIVIGGAWIETQRLRDGAGALAQRLGARALDDDRALHRRLRDVAEEVSIGAGVPVPALYVLDEPSINALAVGESPAQSAVMVTRGALERLERAELQGVVAHEIAHIVGGDAATNAQLAGALYGLLSLRLLGTHLLGSAFGPADAVGRVFPLRLASGIAGSLLSGIGWVGVAAARFLRAGISRQREFLADALAVQITHDRDGLGCALRRIAGEKPADLRAPYAPLVAHFLLAPPARAGDALNLHPPLAERIRRLYGRAMPPITVAGPVARAAQHTPDELSDRPAVSPAAQLVERLRSVSLDYESASGWLEALVGGSCDRAPGCGNEVADAALQDALVWVLSPAGAALRVPLLELLLARVGRWSSARRRELLDRCRRAVEGDGRVDSSEWVYYTLARHRLLPAVSGKQRARRAAVSRLEQSRALAALFAMASAIGEASARKTRDALADTAAMLDVQPPAATPDAVGTTELTRALDVLLALPALSKPILLKMLRTLARTPGDPDYEAFLRAVAAAIDCPAPRAVPVAQRGSCAPTPTPTPTCPAL